jgi:hypothetical protein
LPSAVQSVLIDRATVLQHHLTTYDRQAAAAGGEMSEHGTRVYLAWQNTLTRTLTAIGLQRAPAPEEMDLFARIRAEARASEARAAAERQAAPSAPGAPHPPVARPHAG